MRDINLCEAVMLAVLLVMLTQRRRKAVTKEPFMSSTAHDDKHLVLSDTNGKISLYKISDWKQSMQSVLTAKTTAAINTVKKYVASQKSAVATAANKAYTTVEADQRFIKEDEPVNFAIAPRSGVTNGFSGAVPKYLVSTGAKVNLGSLGAREVLYTSTAPETKFYVTKKK